MQTNIPQTRPRRRNSLCGETEKDFLKRKQLRYDLTIGVTKIGTSPCMRDGGDRTQREGKERKFELDKIRFQNEKEKKEFQNEISALKYSPPQYHEQEFKQDDECEEEEVLIYLPKRMKKSHKKLIKQILAWDDVMLNLPEIEEYQFEVVRLIEDIAEYMSQIKTKQQDIKTYEKSIKPLIK